MQYICLVKKLKNFKTSGLKIEEFKQDSYFETSKYPTIYDPKTLYNTFMYFLKKIKS